MQLILLSFEQQPRIYFVSLPTGERESERGSAFVCVCATGCPARLRYPLLAQAACLKQTSGPLLTCMFAIV